MRSRRHDKIELNFDGLTDSITNLAGALILLVVLVINATYPKQSGVKELPFRENTSGSTQAIDPLLRELARLRDELSSVDGNVEQMEARLPELEAEVEALKERIGTAAE